MSGDGSRAHPFGVVIPDPDKRADERYGCGHEGGHHREDYRPVAGPDSTPREGREAGTTDGHTEALRVRLADILDTLYYDGVPMIEVVWPLIEDDRTAYGDERAAQALRDAARPLRRYGCRAAADGLEVRADEMGPRP